MDNHTELESHEKSNSNKNISSQHSLYDNGLKNSSLPEGQFDNNLPEDNSNECEVDERFIHKISPISKAYGLISEDDGLCHKETSDYNKNSQQTDNSTTDLEKTKFMDDKQFNSGSMNTNNTDNIGLVDAKLQNCVEHGSTKAVEMGLDNSSPSCDNTETAGTSNTEQLLPVEHPLLGKSPINPNPTVFDMIEENVLPHYGVSLLDTNNGTNLMTLEADKSVVISNNNAIPQAESIVTSNFSLNLLKSYDTDDSSDGEACEASFQYREDKNEEDSDRDSDSDSSSTSSSTSIIISDSSDSDSDELYENFNAKPCKPIKAKKELSLEDLPPIEDLKISVPEEDCTPIGKVFQIVDCLVVVQAFKEMPAYNLDTVLFIEGGKPLGKIFDVFGPVAEPYYCVRFNSRDHIKDKKISVDQMVYSAPKTKYTNYVFLAQLMKLKGSDASWEDDDEPPEIYLEYSDDEQEQRAKKKKSRNRNRKAVFRVDSDPDEPARKRHFAYEKRMNERNLHLNAVRNSHNGSRNRMQGFNNLWSPAIGPPGTPPQQPVRASLHSDISHQMFGRPPLFGSRVPHHNAPFPLPPRPGTPRPDHPCNVMRTPPPCFGNPNTLNFSHSEHRTDMSPGLSNKTNNHSYSFVPNHVQASNNFSRWTQPFTRSENPWGNFLASRNDPVINNNPLPSSPFWNQRPPQSPNVPTPFSALPNSPFVPRCPPPQPFWPTQSPPQSRNAPYNNPSRINFNSNLPPPPSPNHFNR